MQLKVHSMVIYTGDGMVIYLHMNPLCSVYCVLCSPPSSSNPLHLSPESRVHQRQSKCRSDEWGTFSFADEKSKIKIQGIIRNYSLWTLNSLNCISSVYLSKLVCVILSPNLLYSEWCPSRLVWAHGQAVWFSSLRTALKCARRILPCEINLPSQQKDLWSTVFSNNLWRTRLSTKYWYEQQVLNSTNGSSTKLRA